MLLDLIDSGSSEKARRAVYLLGFSTLGLAAITIGANTISVLGLEIVFEKERFVEAGRLATLLALIVFFIREFKNYIEVASHLRGRFLTAKHIRENEELADSWGYNTPGPDQSGPEGEFRSLEGQQKYEASRLSKSNETVTLWYSVVLYFLTDLGFPLIFGAAVASDPYILSNYLDGLGAK